MTLAILALVLGPSAVVFVIGCMLVLTRSWRPPVRVPARIKPGGRAI